MQTLSTGANLDSFLISLAASVCYGALIAALHWVRGRNATHNPRYRRVVPGLTLTAWLLFNLGYFHFFHRQSYLVLIISTILSAWLLFQEVYQFWRIGLVGADVETRRGIDYPKALALCSNSLEFLGIGASKLTGAGEAFQKAIDRCDNPGRPIKFLLSSPESKGLQKIARNAGVSEQAYQETVRISLRVISSLRINREKNIEVRFYKEFPAFRLMFIDGEICLTSHYVLGKGDGSQLPQLHIIKKTADQDVDSLYYGFRFYFDSLWEEAEEWDFRRYLDE